MGAYICARFIYVVGSFKKMSGGLLENSLNATAGRCTLKCPCFPGSLQHKQHYERLWRMHHQKSSLPLCVFGSPLALKEQVWFYVVLGSSCSEHLVVAFTEHSGRQEESDRAMDLSVPLRCRPLRQESRVAWCDKRVSIMAALQETGRGLTLEMGETCCRRSLRVEKSREISQKVCWKVVGDEIGEGG